MNRVHRYRHLALAIFPLVLLSVSGCSPEEVSDKLEQAETSAGEAADAIVEDVGAVVKEGEKMAGELSERASGYLSPLKQKFGNLESLKDSPEKLKTAVEELIQSIDEKAEDIKLPEAVSKALETVKTKLVELRDYLGGEFEQTKIDERIQEITDSIKSGLGISKE